MKDDPELKTNNMNILNPFIKLNPKKYCWNGGGDNEHEIQFNATVILLQKDTPTAEL